MKNIITLVVAIVLMTAAPASAYAYSAPKITDADGLACSRTHPERNMMADVAWDNPKTGTGFTLLKYSRHSDFSDAKYQTPKQHAAQFGMPFPSSAKDDQTYRVDGLAAGKRYYFKVAVSTYEGERLSAYSKALSATMRKC